MCTVAAVGIGTTVAVANGGTRFFPWLKQNLFEIIFNRKIRICRNNDMALFILILKNITKQCTEQLSGFDIFYIQEQDGHSRYIGPLPGDKIDMGDFYIQADQSIDGSTTIGFNIFCRKSKLETVAEWLDDLLKKIPNNKTSFKILFGFTSSINITTENSTHNDESANTSSIVMKEKQIKIL